MKLNNVDHIGLTKYDYIKTKNGTVNFKLVL